jgi:SH3 domain-containing YSC84-like protein 1
MHKLFICPIVALLLAIPVMADSKVDERLRIAATTLDEILNIPDNIPRNVLDKSLCVVVIPSAKRLALGIGGSYGRGVMVCRSGEDFRGPWGAPTMMALDSGSVGLQLGSQSIDFVLLVMYPLGANALLENKVKLGVDATAVAGPKGGSLTVQTDAWVTAQILSYSRARGLFSGISLHGSSLGPDDDANEDLYGKKIKAHDIVRTDAVKPPQAAKSLVDCLERASPSNIAA